MHGRGLGAPLPMAGRTSELQWRREQWRPAVGAASKDDMRVIDKRTGMFARGTTVRGTLDYLQAVGGDEVVDEVLGTLNAADRKLVTSVEDMTEVPYRLALELWARVDAVLAPTAPDWIERSGSWSIEQGGMRRYSGLIKKPSPLEFLTQHVSLFHLYYRPGDMILVEEAVGRAVVRLVGFEPASTLFCRRLSGGWSAALRIAGGRDVVCVHSRCSMEGDLFCEWELRWK